MIKKKRRGGERCAYVHRQLFLEWDTEVGCLGEAHGARSRARPLGPLACAGVWLRLHESSDSLSLPASLRQPAWSLGETHANSGLGTWHAACLGLCNVRSFLSFESQVTATCSGTPACPPKLLSWAPSTSSPPTSQHTYHSLMSRVHCPFPHVHRTVSHWSRQPVYPHGPTMCSIIQETNERG